MIILNCFLVFLLTVNQFQFGKFEVADNYRIMEGDLAEPGEIKYIIVTLHGNKSYKCGGGIIDNYYVLSAAHCFVKNNQIDDANITVIAGTNDYHNKDDPRRVEVEVEKIYVPRKFISSEYINDIALLKLKKSLDIEENDLEKLSLPRKPSNLTNRMALMAGFGYDLHRLYMDRNIFEISERRATSGLLRKADIKMYDNKKCQELYPKDPIYDFNLCGKMVKESQRKEYGICNGDSGGPLVYDSTVVGIVSWSYGCDETTIPFVYTRVSSFLDFIDNVMNDETDDILVKEFY